MQDISQTAIHGIQFNSHDFTYSSDTTKKDRLGYYHQAQRCKGFSTIYLSISSNGYCRVRINSNDRAPISYYGILK